MKLARQKIKRILYTVLETIISQVISQSFCKIALNAEELELLEFALVIPFLKKIVIEGFLTSFNVSRAWFMLTILIKAYCVIVLVDTKPIYLNKPYLFQNKIFCLDKIYLCFSKIKLSKLTLYKLT